MKHWISLLCIAAWLVLGWAPATDAGSCHGKMTVTIENFSSFSNHIVVMDELTGAKVYEGTLKPWKKASFRICKSSAGYGRVKARASRSSWVHFNLVSPGDNLKL